MLQPVATLSDIGRLTGIHAVVGSQGALSTIDKTWSDDIDQRFRGLMPKAGHTGENDRSSESSRKSAAAPGGDLTRSMTTARRGREAAQSSRSKESLVEKLLQRPDPDALENRTSLQHSATSRTETSEANNIRSDKNHPTQARTSVEKGERLGLEQGQPAPRSAGGDDSDATAATAPLREIASSLQASVIPLVSL